MTTTRELITQTLTDEDSATATELVELTGKSETSVRKILKDMQDEGAVEIDKDKGEPAHYRLVSIEDQAYAAANTEHASEKAIEDAITDGEMARDHADAMADDLGAKAPEQPAAPATRPGRKVEVSDADRTAAAVLKAKRTSAGIKRAALAREAGTTDAKLWRIEERAHIHDGEVEAIEPVLDRMIAAAKTAEPVTA
jgi:predicted ArsR family transcriptional regulator